MRTMLVFNKGSGFAMHDAVPPEDALTATAKLKEEELALRVIVDRPGTSDADRAEAEARLAEIARELHRLAPMLPGAHSHAATQARGTGLEAQVARELAKPENKGKVIAYVDESRGVVRSYLLPTPPPGRAAALPDKMTKAKARK
jgi:hypothetical protein